MNKIIAFFDKNYLYVLGIFIIIIIGVSAFVLHGRNQNTLSEKTGDQYFESLLKLTGGENLKPEIVSNFRKILNEDSGNYSDLSAMIIANDALKNNNFVESDANFLHIYNDKKAHKILRDYALYIYAQSLLNRMDIKKFEEIQSKLSDKSFIYRINSMELSILHYINLKDYEKASKIVNEALSESKLSSLKARLSMLRDEIKYLSN